MALHIQNSYSDTKEKFEPRDPNRVTIYNCGPTVYNFNHIGNFRSYVFVDILRRYLLTRGYKLDHAMNITDVDDKIIDNALKENKTIREFTDPFTKAFLEDIAELKIQDVEHRPRATESIPAMLDLIAELEKRGHTYQQDGSIYFRLSSFPEYGKLSGLEAENLLANADGRFEADEYTKEDARDFALWKAAVREGETTWDSKWGAGRPGWHLECSAMIRDIYGADGIDIHIGGIDLLFPHHENEIAQSCCAYPHENFARFWMHNEHLLVAGKKMSKSAGNFYTLRDLTRKEMAEAMIAKKKETLGGDGIGEEGDPSIVLKLIERGKILRALRYLLASFHYRTKLNFTFDNLRAADQACDRMQAMVVRLMETAEMKDADAVDAYIAGRIQDVGGAGERGAEIVALGGSAGAAMEKFIAGMDDDLNTARGLAAAFDFIRDLNTALEANKLSKEQAGDALLFFHRINEVLDVLVFDPAALDEPEPELDEDLAAYMTDMLEKRKAARAAKDFAEADRIRDEIHAKGIKLIDTPQGTKWEKA